MTKEEAKLVLDNARPQTKEIDRQFYDDEDLNNALDMAINALEQNTVSQETYDSEYLARKQAEQKLYEIEQNISDDCVSRAELKKWLDMNFSFGGALRKLEMFDRIDKELPPVTPARKSGLHWIERFDNESMWLECPHCHIDSIAAYNYCPNCGASFKEEKRGNENE